MDATEALNLLLPIPANQFITGTFSNNRNKCCAIGHLQRLKSANPEDYHSYNCIDDGEVEEFTRITTSEFLAKQGIKNATMAIINNYTDIDIYTENEPKDRVIHLLRDMVKAGY